MTSKRLPDPLNLFSLPDWCILSLSPQLERRHTSSSIQTDALLPTFLASSPWVGLVSSLYLCQCRTVLRRRKDDERQVHEQVFDNGDVAVREEHKSKFSHELLAGGVAWEGTRLLEQHMRKRDLSLCLLQIEPYRSFYSIVKDLIDTPYSSYLLPCLSTRNVLLKHANWISHRQGGFVSLPSW